MKKILLGLAALVFGFAWMCAPVYASNTSVGEDICDKVALTEEEKVAAGCGTPGNVWDFGVNLIKTAIAIAGIIAALVIVVAGQRFVSANGDAQRIAQARNMLLYAVIGLIIAILSFSVVTFVSQAIESSSNQGADNPGTSSSVPLVLHA